MKKSALPRGIRPKAEHGQNFLMSRAILERTCEYAALSNEDIVLEVGPGIGTLTEQLALRAREVHAIEIDRQFEPLLAQLQTRFPNLHVHWGDAVEMDFPAFNKFVSNLPYKPALPLIMKLLDHEFELATVLIQQRLARRLAAKPGGQGYSRISVFVQRTASLRLLEVVKPEHFEPPPAVDSALLRIRKTRPRFEVASEEEFRLLLDMLFLQREHTVSKALHFAEPASKVDAVVAKLPAQLTRRVVAQVTPEEFGLIAAAVHDAGLAIPPIPDEIKRKAQKFF